MELWPDDIRSTQCDKRNTVTEEGVVRELVKPKKIIIEKVDEFLKEMIKWEVPNNKNKLGY